MKTGHKKTSLRGLRIFCVAAKYLNYRVASEELSVTASAVSQQIKSLEEELGLTLFLREKRAMVLTEAGKRLYEKLEPEIAKIDAIVAEAQSSVATRQLRLSVQPFFASEMFVPRLEEFSAAHPGIELFVDTSDETAEKHPGNVDASIRLFSQTPVNLDSDALFPLRLIAACSPDFLSRVKSKEGDMQEPFPMLVHTSRPEAWDTWSRASKIKLPPPSRTVRLDSMIAVARAAERGVGAALVPVPLSDNWFKYGALVPMYEHVVTMPETYYLVYPPSSGRSEEIRALREWVLEVFQDI